MARELRKPLAQPDFNRLDLKVLEKTIRVPMWNLRWASHAGAGHLFFASQSGRLTPAGSDVRCLYLAANRETSFLELYGDDLAAAWQRGLWLTLRGADLDQRMFLKTGGIVTARLYDLSVQRGAQAINMDLATLYSSEVSHAREFARRIHDHPSRFDGIQYESRHTKCRCMVLWGTWNPSLAGLMLEPSGTLREALKHDDALPGGAMLLFGQPVFVASIPNS